MAIITAYVRAPVSGYISGRDKYCITSDPNCQGSGSTHFGCRNWASRVDVAGSGSLFLRVNYPNVLSIKTYVELRCCGSANCNNNYKRTITVDLYGKQNGVCYIGSVMYGHVTSPTVSNGSTYNLSSSSFQLGTVTTGSCAGCSTGPHSHMEVKDGSVAAPCCGASVSTSTNIYRFTWDDAKPCPL